MKRSGKYGHPIDEETRKKISETVKKRWQEKEYREKVVNAHKHSLTEEWKENISLSMIGISKSEEMKKNLSKAKKGKLIDKLKGHEVSLETRIKISNSLKGHKLPERKQRDKELKEYVESTGRRIIFIWEHEINDDWFDITDYLFKGGDANA